AASNPSWESVNVVTWWPSTSSTFCSAEAKDSSSSMSSTLLMHLVLSGGGHYNAEHGAFARFALKFEVAALFVNNPGSDRQPQSGAVLFSAEKWVEDLILDFQRNTGTRILDLENHCFGHLPVQFADGFA